MIARMKHLGHKLVSKNSSLRAFDDFQLLLLYGRAKRLCKEDGWTIRHYCIGMKSQSLKIG